MKEMNVFRDFGASSIAFVRETGARKRIIRSVGIIVAAITIGMIPIGAAAQNAYPNKIVRIVVGVAAGGLIDVSARLLAKHMQQRLGQPIIVENKPGANTTIGADTVLKAAPDGYTLFYGGAMSASPIFVKNGAVDFVTQMKPVSLVLSAPFYLLVNNKVPANSIQDLIAYSKKNPGKLNFADNAPASSLVMHAIAERTGLNFTPIPYKGSAPSLTALIAGEVEMVLDTVPNYLQHIKTGKVRAVMSTGRARSQLLPDVPTGTEVKVIDFNTGSVFGLWAPPGTPDAIVQRLNAEIAAIAKDPEFREKFRQATQVDPVASTPAELLKVIESDKALYSGVAKRIGHEPQ
jgi:tripartite-type tricarboxylate transporter receptor subunit TctC